MMRGAEIGPGYVPGLGRVRVWADLDSPNILHILTNRDETRIVARNRVTFTKRKGKNRGK